MGLGNWIGEGVRICENVQIGNGNRIFPGTILFPNTRLGDNNVILEDGRIGEHPVNMDYIRDKIYKGVVFGNNNAVHARAVICGGFTGQTRIGDHNRISHAAHIGHDAYITSHVHLYPNVFVGGHSILLPFSGIGIGGGIHQQRVLGAYAFIGMISAATHNAFPFMIHAGNRATRMNRKRVPDAWLPYEQSLLALQSLCSLGNGIPPESIETLIDVFEDPDLRQHLHDYVAATRDPSLKAT
jgi:acyl-[acyl carrier protein]--UDP-N-acetylglucosamine O-acyltransferase